MSKIEQTALFQSLYLLTLQVYKLTSNFPREYRHTLGEHLKKLAHEMIDLIAEVNVLVGNAKCIGIDRLEAKKDSFRIHLRIAYDLKLMSHGSMGLLSEKLEEIGKQLGGWKKWASTRR